MKGLRREPTRDEIWNALRVSSYYVSEENKIEIEPEDFLPALNRQGVITDEVLDSYRLSEKIYNKYANSRFADEFFESREWKDPITSTKLEEFGISKEDIKGLLNG